VSPNPDSFLDSLSNLPFLPLLVFSPRKPVVINGLPLGAHTCRQDCISGPGLWHVFSTEMEAKWLGSSRVTDKGLHFPEHQGHRTTE
jgi:hypothetical protein